MSAVSEGVQQCFIDQAIDQWQVCLNACFKAMLRCAVPQLSIICYETFKVLALVVEQF